MKALITGITGQDGSYLAEILLSKGYDAYGIIRRCSTFNSQRIDHIFDKITLQYGDMTDCYSLQSAIEKYKPDEIYNLAAQSHVKVSFETPIYTSQADAIGVLNLLEAVRNVSPKTKIYNASTSEMFGSTLPPQSETSVFNPVSPYGCSKVFAYQMCKVYRDAYNLFVCNGILFNHESPRRGSTFVTKKIVESAVKIKNNKQEKLILGNIHAKRDWGYAPEYCEAMVLVLQHSHPDDYVIATGESHTVAEFAERIFGMLGLDWTKHVIEDERYRRPNEVDFLLGDASKAKKILGWQPKVSFYELCKIMLEHELKKYN